MSPGKGLFFIHPIPFIMRIIIAALWLIAGAGQLTAQSFLSTSSATLSFQSSAVATASWDATQVDLGTLEGDAAVVHEFVVYNTGDSPLQIEAVKPSCGCTVAEYTQEAIQPGEAGYVVATYGHPKVGTFSKSVSVQTNADAAPVILVMRGEVVAGK